MISAVIQIFRDNETERVVSGRYLRRAPNEIQRVVSRKLELIDDAAVIEDIRGPRSDRWEDLQGHSDSPNSIRINDRWRVCFEWRDGNAYNVEIVDYH